jgi:hypothetical protein
MTTDLFTDKYFPKTFDEFIGNVEIVDFVRTWANKVAKWRKAKTYFIIWILGSRKNRLSITSCKTNELAIV